MMGIKCPLLELTGIECQLCTLHYVAKLKERTRIMRVKLRLTWKMTERQEIEKKKHVCGNWK